MLFRSRCAQSGPSILAYVNNLLYSQNGGQTWLPCSTTGSSPGTTIYFTSVIYVNGTFVAMNMYGCIITSTDGINWVHTSGSKLSYSQNWGALVYGNGKLIAIASGYSMYSTDNGQTWSTPALNIPWSINYGDYVGAAYGNGIFVAVCGQKTIYSTNGSTWASSVLQGPLTLNRVIYVNGKFIGTSGRTAAYSTDGINWSLPQLYLYGNTITAVSYGDGLFIVGAGDYVSTDAQTWSSYGIGIHATCSQFGYYIPFSSSDSVSLVVPPLQLTNRSFSSSVYLSIRFDNQDDAAFWGFDSRDGLTYSLPATPPWTYTQSGWISGFLPPSLSSWNDSVAHKLCKSVRLMAGKQTLKEYSGEYIELYNDLMVPYENKAILKLMNGTLDQTQAVSPRQYYVSLPLGIKEIPLCALQRQQVSLDIEFESYYNLSQNLNQGTGSFTDNHSFTAFDASALLSSVNVQTTFSYNQYILAVTYAGKLVVYDTTKTFTDPASYIIISTFTGLNVLKQFCVLSGVLYIGVSDGQLWRGNVDELIQGNTSSFSLNSYRPTYGSLTGTLVADFRYVYYSVSNTVTSNVFFNKYDTTGSFTSPSSYVSVDFTKTFNSNITGVYQTLSDGKQLIMIPKGVSGNLYTCQLTANVLTQWYPISYTSNSITEGTVVGNSIYFIADGFSILKYQNLPSNLDIF